MEANVTSTVEHAVKTHGHEDNVKLVLHISFIAMSIGIAIMAIVLQFDPALAVALPSLPAIMQEAIDWIMHF